MNKAKIIDDYESAITVKEAHAKMSKDIALILCDAFPEPVKNFEAIDYKKAYNKALNIIMDLQDSVCYRTNDCRSCVFSDVENGRFPCGHIKNEMDLYLTGQIDNRERKNNENNKRKE